METSSNDHKQRVIDRELTWARSFDHEPTHRHELAPGVAVELPIRAYAQAEGLTWVLDVDVIDGRLACTSLDVERGNDGPAITSELVRRFPIGRHVRYIVEANLTVDDPSDPFARFTAPDDLLTSGPTDEALRYVASIYRVAEITDGNPTQAVEALGLPRRTVQRWINKAREKGII